MVQYDQVAESLLLLEQTDPQFVSLKTVGEMNESQDRYDIQSLKELFIELEDDHYY